MEALNVHLANGERLEVKYLAKIKKTRGEGQEILFCGGSLLKNSVFCTAGLVLENNGEV